MIASKGKETTNWKIHQMLFYCSCVTVAGVVGGLLGLGVFYCSYCFPMEVPLVIMSCEIPMLAI